MDNTLDPVPVPPDNTVKLNAELERYYEEVLSQYGNIPQMHEFRVFFNLPKQLR